MYAPIIVFSYNRPGHLKSTLDALSKNDLAADSILYIYCDGAREDASDDQKLRVEKNRQVAHSANGFKEIIVVERDKNYGLANNIVGGVTDIVNRYGRVITLEDDIITSSGFLRYMNAALSLYEGDERVMHISGYMYPHKESLPETFFYEVPYPGGGWATWKRAWEYFSNDIDELYSYWCLRWKEFNKYGGTYLQQQLEANKKGVMYTWFIRWHAVLLRMGGLTLYPGKSLTNNIGFDNTGVNCKTMHRFDILQPAECVEVRRIRLKENRRAARVIYHFYSGHWYSKRYRKQFLSKIKQLFHSLNHA